MFEESERERPPKHLVVDEADLERLLSWEPSKDTLASSQVEELDLTLIWIGISWMR